MCLLPSISCSRESRVSAREGLAYSCTATGVLSERRSGSVMGARSRWVVIVLPLRTLTRSSRAMSSVVWFSTCWVARLVVFLGACVAMVLRVMLG